MGPIEMKQIVSIKILHEAPSSWKAAKMSDPLRAAEKHVDWRQMAADVCIRPGSRPNINQIIHE